MNTKHCTTCNETNCRKVRVFFKLYRLTYAGPRNAGLHAGYAYSVWHVMNNLADKRVASVEFRYEYVCPRKSEIAYGHFTRI